MEGHEEVFKTPLRFQLNIGCWLRDFKVSSFLFKHIQINCPITTTSPKLMKLVAYDIPTIRFIKQINIKTFFKILEIYITTNYIHYSLVAYDTPTICFEKNKSILKTNFSNIGSNYYY